MTAVACGSSDDGDSPKPSTAGSSSDAGSGGSANPATAGRANDGSSSGSGGNVTTGGKPAAAGSAGQGTAGTATSEGGAPGAAGEGSGGTPGEAGAGGAGEDPRPGCAKVPGIQLSNLRIVKGAGPGETAELEIDAKNGTDEFVSYNPAKIVCTGDAVDSATDQLSTFGVSQGETMTVQLRVTFADDAQPGDIASCIVRGFILGKSPEDCQNAQTKQIVVTVE